MKNLRDHVIKCVEREGREAESGSDGEEIHDLPIRPVFDKVELGVTCSLVCSMHMNVLKASGFTMPWEKDLCGPSVTTLTKCDN